MVFRVLRAVPIPPQYNISEISSSLWILECEQTCKQGTGFELQGYGIVTCSHVLGTDTKAFKADNPNSKYKVHVIKNNPVIDLSILQIEGVDLKGLAIGSSDNLNLMDHIAISGFPNYRLGDTGVFIPGLVVGFRMVSSIRRILTNAPIIAGNSGGPVLDAQGEVIGVAVTGADKMEDAQQTENHAIIPIDALGLL